MGGDISQRASDAEEVRRGSGQGLEGGLPPPPFLPRRSASGDRLRLVAAADPHLDGDEEPELHGEGLEHGEDAGP